MAWWPVIKIFWALLALAIAAMAMILFARARGVLTWKKSLKAELSALEQMRTTVSESGRQALDIIQTRCRDIINTHSPEVMSLGDLPGYIQSIAACFHPQSSRPELQITVGAFLQSLEKSLERFDRILRRPGFRRLRSANIRSIKSTRRRYLRLTNSRIFAGYLRYRKRIQALAKLRLLLFFDPLMGLAYLSNRLTILMLVKYLLVDFYLYFGRLTLEAFEAPDRFIDKNEMTREELEETIEELDAIREPETLPQDPQIREIRDRLVGLSSILTSDPSFADWKTSVREAAAVIARKHFPDSQMPVEEAAVGPLLERCRAWLDTLAKGEEYLISRRFYQMRLDTLYRAKGFSNILLPGILKQFLKRAYLSAGWLRWPLKVYRWTKKSSPWVVAIEVGWMAVRKASLAHLYGKTFDRACRELEIVYRASRGLKEKR